VVDEPDAFLDLLPRGAVAGAGVALAFGARGRLPTGGALLLAALPLAAVFAVSALTIERPPH